MCHLHFPSLQLDRSAKARHDPLRPLQLLMRASERARRSVVHVLLSRLLGAPVHARTSAYVGALVMSPSRLRQSSLGRPSPLRPTGGLFPEPPPKHDVAGEKHHLRRVKRADTAGTQQIIHAQKSGGKGGYCRYSH